MTAAQWREWLGGKRLLDWDFTVTSLDPHPDCTRCGGTGVARDEHDFGAMESGPCECLDRNDEPGKEAK